MGFTMRDFFNDESKKEIKSGWKPVKISVKKLKPASDKTNFYHADVKEIKELAESIELIGLQQYPVVRPVEGTDEYEVIAGHKRRLAILRLLDEGKEEFEMVPCKVETMDNIKNELILIFTNSTQRERTDYEKMQEVERVRKLLTEYQKEHELTGRKQNIIAEILGTNKTKVGTLDNINNNLCEPFKEEFAAGKISTSTANEIAGLKQDAQQALYETYKETGSLTAKDAKALKDAYSFPEGFPDNLKSEVIKYAEETGISVEEAAENILGRQQRTKEQPKPDEVIENTHEPSKTQETAQEEPQKIFEPETRITYNAPTTSINRRSLIINGKINPYKEYNGMPVNYFMSAIIGSNLFDEEFWRDWKKNTNAKVEYISKYAGSTTTYSFKSLGVEECGATLTNEGLQIVRYATKQQATILYDDLAELIDFMIYTKIIQITSVEKDLKYWAARSVKELSAISKYLTENEVYVLQDFIIRCKERADKIRING